MLLVVLNATRSLVIDLFNAAEGKTRASPDTGAVPPQLAGSDHKPLFVPVQVRVAAKSGSEVATTNAKAISRFIISPVIPSSGDRTRDDRRHSAEALPGQTVSTRGASRALLVLEVTGGTRLSPPAARMCSTVQPMLIRPLLALLFAVVLDPRAPLDDVLAPQESRTYDVQTTAGQYIEIAVESAELVD